MRGNCWNFLFNSGSLMQNPLKTQTHKYARTHIQTHTRAHKVKQKKIFQKIISQCLSETCTNSNKATRAWAQNTKTQRKELEIITATPPEEDLKTSQTYKHNKEKVKDIDGFDLLKLRTQEMFWFKYCKQINKRINLIKQCCDGVASSWKKKQNTNHSLIYISHI